jgi:hypothetical protein
VDVAFETEESDLNGEVHLAYIPVELQNIRRVEIGDARFGETDHDGSPSGLAQHQRVIAWRQTLEVMLPRRSCRGDLNWSGSRCIVRTTLPRSRNMNRRHNETPLQRTVYYHLSVSIHAGLCTHHIMRYLLLVPNAPAKSCSTLHASRSEYSIHFVFDSLSLLNRRIMYHILKILVLASFVTAH